MGAARCCVRGQDIRRSASFAIERRILPVSRTEHATGTPDLRDAPADLRELLEGLATHGIPASLPTAGPDFPLAAPLVVRAPLSTAIIAERNE
jgi:hypothetical protein